MLLWYSAVTSVVRHIYDATSSIGNSQLTFQAAKHGSFLTLILGIIHHSHINIEEKNVLSTEPPNGCTGISSQTNYRATNICLERQQNTQLKDNKKDNRDPFQFPRKNSTKKDITLNQLLAFFPEDPLCFQD